jgi:hypothetical protein
VGVVIALVAAGVVVVSSFGRSAPKTEIGIVMSVDSASLTDVRGFTVRTADGRTVDFRIGELENGSQFPPGHLAEHQVTAAPIRVTYLEDGGELVAVRLDDADLPGSS